MTDHEFEGMLRHALLRSCKQTWLDHPSNETLQDKFPDTNALDERVEQSLKDMAAPVKTLKPPLHKRVMRYAAMFFLPVSILFGALMLHSDARAYIINLVTTWYEDHVKYSFYEESHGTIPTDWDFAYIPTGFTLFSEDRTDTYCTYQFEGVDGELLDISISSESGISYTDNENFTIERKFVNGREIDIYTATNHTSNMIACHRKDLGVLVTILGDVPTEELILVLESMTP